MYDGFVRARETVTRLLSDRRTTFVVISTLEATTVAKRSSFATGAGPARPQPGAQSCSTRCCPPNFPLDKNYLSGENQAERAKDARRALDVDRPLAARVLLRCGRELLNSRWWPRREASSKTSLPRPAPKCLATGPRLTRTSADMEGLLRLGEDRLWT